MPTLSWIGKEFLYFMVFEKKIAGAYTVDKAKELIRPL